MIDRVEVMARTEDGLVFATLFPSKVILRLYVMRVLLIVTTVMAERAEIMHMSNEIELECLEMNVAEEISFSIASHTQ